MTNLSWARVLSKRGCCSLRHQALKYLDSFSGTRRSNTRVLKELGLLEWTDWNSNWGPWVFNANKFLTCWYINLSWNKAIYVSICFNLLICLEIALLNKGATTKNCIISSSKQPFYISIWHLVIGNNYIHDDNWGKPLYSWRQYTNLRLYLECNTGILEVTSRNRSKRTLS